MSSFLCLLLVRTRCNITFMSITAVTLVRISDRINVIIIIEDNILVSGKDEKDHEKNLDLVFTVLSDAGLKLKREKCLLAQDSVT